MPFAFVTLSTPSHPTSAVPSKELYAEIQKLVRSQIGAIASLGGMVQGKGMIPKTRSGKTLRRVLRELVENAVHDDFEKEVQVPATVEFTRRCITTATQSFCRRSRAGESIPYSA